LKVGGVKMKKNEKKTHFTIKIKIKLFTALFWLVLWLCISRMICGA
jgi:hypothetical protein